MPTYLYICEVSNEEFEEFHSITEQLEECPKCKEKGLSDHKPKRLINCSSKGVVELVGQELADKIKADAQILKKDAAAKEKVYANLLGESLYNDLQTKLDRKKRK